MEEDRCLHRLFAEQAQRTPEAPAVVDPEGTLTYAELDRRAERLGAYLVAQGVRPDDAIGLYLDHCNDYVATMLAALKAGGAYMPLELAYPDALLADVLDDAKPRVVVTTSALAGRLPQQQARLCLDEPFQPSAETAQPEREPTLDDLAFISYSSGTTGLPKGIANAHRAPVRSYTWRFGLHDYGPGDRVACNVFFIWEVLRPLLRGGTAVVIPDDVIYDPAALIDYLDATDATETLVTPSLLEAVLNTGVEGRLPSLRTVWLNGEVVTRTLARRALQALPNARLWNLYSISETHEIAAGDLADLVETDATYCPVGPPMDAAHTYLLDAEQRPVDDGQPGELYAGGPGLARGYVNLPERTAERFVPDPFSDEPGARMYRTGDRARLLPDGSVEVLGRVDFMAKIRGYSVELGSVEAAIEQHLAVDNCVVVAEGEEGSDKRLVAYLVRSADGSADGRAAGWEVDAATGRSPQIRRVLAERLPHYGIPAVYVELDMLPLQETTGKVDRKRLPAPPARAQGGEREPAEALGPNATRQDRERVLARSWDTVLELEEGDAAPDDDFFDLGGHSLAAAELLARIEGAFGVRLPMGALLTRPTVAGMVDSIEQAQAGMAGGQADVDLRAAAVLEPEITPPAAAARVVTLADARAVLLTGATGFLGAFLLDALLDEPRRTVRCLVRAAVEDGSRGPRDGGDALAPIRDNLARYGLLRPERMERVVPVAGDLSQPLLGLDEQDFDDLAAAVDLVVHAAAAVNLVYPYSALEGPNVAGTREVLRLACRGATPLHHVSTNGIFPPEGQRWHEDADLDSLAEARADGYGQSKWVAEQLVWAAAGRGLPVCVYRPGNIGGHSLTGASNPRDFLGALVVESLRLRCAPQIDGWRWEQTPVDVVARAVTQLAGRPEAIGRAFHLVDADPVPAEEVFAALEDLGHPLKRLPYGEWVEVWRASSRGQGPTGGVIATAPAADEVWNGNTYDDSAVGELLGGGAQRPAMDAALLRTYLDWYAEQGWVDQPAG